MSTSPASCPSCGGALDPGERASDCPCNALPGRAGTRSARSSPGGGLPGGLCASPLDRTLEAWEALAILEARKFPPVADPAGVGRALAQIWAGAA